MCDKIFHNNDAMMQHIRSSAHHPLAYQCAGCESQFADLSGLYQHVEISDCTEGLSYGTESIGKLLIYLWEVLHVRK